VQIGGWYPDVPEEKIILSDRQLFWIFNIVLMLLEIFVRLVFVFLCMLAGTVLGVMATVSGVPFWIPMALLVPLLLSKRFYLSLFMVGILLPTLSQVIR